MPHKALFKGNLAILSSMYPCTIQSEELTFKCVESAFHAAKFDNYAIKTMLSTMDGYTAKTYAKARRNEVKDNWSAIKLDVMYDLVDRKFDDFTLSKRIVKIPDELFVEINTWGDIYWGVNSLGIGENHLGRILIGKKYRLLGVPFDPSVDYWKDSFAEALSFIS